MNSHRVSAVVRQHSQFLKTGENGLLHHFDDIGLGLFLAQAPAVESFPRVIRSSLVNLLVGVEDFAQIELQLVIRRAVDDSEAIAILDFSADSRDTYGLKFTARDLCRVGFVVDYLDW